MTETPHAPRKQCSDCKEWFPANLEHFPAYKRSKDGLRNMCRPCRSKRDKHYRQANHEVYLAHDKRYREKEPEKVRESDRRYRQTPNGRRNGIKRQRRYRTRYHERTLQSRQRYYWSHLEQEQAYCKGYRTTHREYFRLAYAIRRARLKGVPGTYTLAQIAELLKRQKYRCYYAACGHAKFEKRKGRYVYHIDHTFPITREGARNDISHLVLTCPPCNRKKHNKYPWEWFEGGRLL